MDPPDPERPFETRVLNRFQNKNLYAPGQLSVGGSHAFVADGVVEILDLSNLPELRWSGAYEPTGELVSLTVAGDRLLITTGLSGDVELVHIADPLQPKRLGVVTTPGHAVEAGFAGDRLLVADGTAGLQVFNVADPANPRWLGAYATGGYARALRVMGHCAFVGDAITGVHVVDFSDPSRPRRLGGNSLPSGLMSLGLADGRLLVADQYDRGWMLEAVPSFKRIAREGHEVAIDWVAFEGTRLQQSVAVGEPVWADVPGAEGTNRIRLPLLHPQSFFRLMKP